MRHLIIYKNAIDSKAVCLIIFQFFITTLSVYSQEKNTYKELTLTGVVYDIETLDSLAFSKIIINKKRSLVTDNTGYFNIRLSNKDTITVTRLGYLTSEIIISELTTNSDSLHLNILMKEQVYSIPEVSVFPYKSYGEFIRATTNHDTINQALSNAYENIKILNAQIQKGYFPANDGRTNYNYLMNYKNSSSNSIVLFSSPPNKGIIPALKKILKH